MEDFSDRELRLAYWWATHREQWQRILLGIFIAIVAVLWIVSIALWARFFWYEGRFQAAMRQFGQSGVNPALVSRPIPLTLGRSFVLPIDVREEDRALEIENTNASWAAHITYRLGEGGRVQETTLLPHERKFLLDLSVARSTAGAAFANPILAVNWQRIKDYETLRDDRLQLVVRNQQFIQASRGSFGVPADRALFTVTNETAFTYASPTFIVSLWNGGDLFAVNRVIVDPLQPQETQRVEARWLPPIPEASIPPTVEIRIEPDIDITDPASFL